MSFAPHRKISQWQSQILNARCVDQHGLRRALKGAKGDSDKLAQLEQRLQDSVREVERLKRSTPEISFPEELPISQRREEIAKLIKNHQIVILAGETGSGKTTQLPKICMDLGFGSKGLIGHTQPRRIAARTVAARIASELNSPLGATVGYQVRFKDLANNQTQVKLMTDGVLLAEFQRDRFLSRYEVIIIDEAHERSLNIDFLLGLLKPLCKKRPELKIIITSATIDLEKFAEHFTIDGKPAPIIEVSGRTYPVELIYQPAQQDGPALPDLITETVKKIARNEAKGVYSARGDILVFCAGEREIRDAAQALRRAQLPVQVLPLYSRLSVAEQNKVFQPTQQRKVVLATNVAETSITVPGIAYVIDPGVARISRYSFRSKVQRLPVEAISQASANQRMGRCGRVANGVCIRLYSEEDFNSRSEFTPAEILRSNLASVILKMLRLQIHDIDKFEFIDRPDSRLLNDGYKLLEELHAISSKQTLTKVGRQMSDLPVDPRFARILLSANEHGCLRDALVLISVLSIQDPRERPAEKQQAADNAHRLLHHHQSDFFSYLILWQAINDARRELSNSKFKQLCTDRFWSIARIFEWRELYRQLAMTCKELGFKLNEWKTIDVPQKVDQGKKKGGGKNSLSAHFDERYQAVHQALLCGLLSNIATKDVDDSYLATRGRAMHLFPGSAQAKRKPKWLVAGEFLETSRLFAHTVGQIKPEWAIDSAPHLCKYSYSEARYHARSGTVVAQRKTLLYGLVLRDKERVNYGPINPREARELFIRQALVEENYQSKVDEFYEHNRQLVKDIEKIETKTRRRNLLVSEQVIFDFYAERIPADIYSRTSFENWLKGVDPDLLKLDRSQLLATQIDNQEIAQFPDHIDVLGKAVKIIYRFEPGQVHDGVTMLIPVEVLAPFPQHIGDWLVPGLLREKCIALIKTLPKNIRRNFAPAADAVDRILHQLPCEDNDLHLALAQQLHKLRGVKVTPELFDVSKLDDYYLANYRVIDVDGSIIDEDRDLIQLKARYADSVQQAVHADNAPQRLAFEKHNITEWNFGELSDTLTYDHQGMTVTAYPELVVNEDQSLSLQLNERADIACYNTAQAVLKLAQVVLASGAQKQAYKYLQKELLASKPQSKSATNSPGLGSLASQLSKVSAKQSDKSEWQDELILAALRHSCFSDSIADIRSAELFQRALDHGAKNWVSTAMDLESALLTGLRHRDQIFSMINLQKVDSIEKDQAIEDIKAQLYRLFEPRLLRYTSIAELKQYPRYLRAIESRLERLKFKNTVLPELATLQTLQQQFDSEIARHDEDLDFLYFTRPALREFSTMMEEWRVSLFAQHLKTQFPVSAKRLSKAWQALTND